MKRVLPYLVIIVVSVIAFYQVAFLGQTLKYDILDGYLHGHYFLSECLRNNIFPLWDPYQQLGFPLYADMLNTNYIVDMALGRLFPYTNVTFHILFIFYVIIAGFGAFKLSRHYNIDSGLGICIAVAYALSGFTTGNAQHIQFIIGAAWFPFALLYFLKLSGEIKVSNALGFIIFTHLLSTGGYPSFVIMLGYILLVVFLFIIVKRARQHEYRFIWSYVLHCTFAFTVLLALSSGVIISLLQSTPYVDRYEGLSYEFAVSNQFPPSALISLIAPLVTAAHKEVFPTDFSMSNHYFGAIFLVLLFYAITRKKSKASLLFLIGGVFLLLFSFGEHFFLHRIFYEYVPFFNKFRHPSSFRFITILFLLVFTGIQVSRNNPSTDENRNRFKHVFIGFTGVMLAVSLASAIFIACKAIGPVDFNAGWESLVKDYGIFGPLFIQASIIFLLCGVFILVYFVRHKSNLLYPLLTGILIIEGIAFTQMNIPYTVTSPYDPLEIRAFILNSPSGFPLPDNRPLSENTEESASFIPVINNTNTYAKTVSPWYMYPFCPDGFRALEKDPVLFNHVIGNPLLYRADSLLPAAKTDSLKVLLGKGADQRNFAFMEDSVYFNHFSQYTSRYCTYDTIQCTFFSPERISYRVGCNHEQFLVLLQNNFPGWKVSLNGQPIRHYTVNRSLIGVFLPAGNHDLSFEYRNMPYQKATIFAFGIFVLMLLFYLGIKLFDNRKSPLKHVYALLILGVLAVIYLVLQKTIPFSRIQQKELNDMTLTLEAYFNNHPKDSAFVLFNTESPDSFPGVRSHYQRFRYPDESGAIQRMADTMPVQHFIYVWSNVADPPELRDMLSVRYGNPVELYKSRRSSVTVYSKDTMTVNGSGLHVNTYEAVPDEWSSDGIIFGNDDVHGNFEILKEDREYSSTFRQTIEKPGKSLRIYAEVQSFSSDTGSCHLVITLIRKGTTIKYHALDLRQYEADARGWKTGFTSAEISSRQMKRGDELLVYCWNSGKNEAIFIDNFRVKLFPY